MTTRDFNNLIGLSRDEVIGRVGEPTVRESDRFVYAHPLGFGAHHEQRYTNVQFQDGRASAVWEETKPIGCVIIPMDDFP